MTGCQDTVVAFLKYYRRYRQKLWRLYIRFTYGKYNQNSSYEITINEIKNVIFGLCYRKPSSMLRQKLKCSPSWVLDEIQIFLGKPCLNNKDLWPGKQTL